MTAVAVLGLGAMGSRMALALRKAGHAVTGWNRTHLPADHALLAASLHLARTPAEAVQTADVVLAMVRDDAASRQVWLDPDHGALAAMQAHAVAVDASTLSPTWVQALAHAAGQAQRRFVEAPVVGSRPQADAGQLVVLAGGAAADVDAVRPLLLAAARAVHHVGAAGAGSRLKLAANGLFAAQVVALAEAVRLLEAGAGEPAVDPVWLRDLPVMSPSALGALDGMQRRAFAPLFPIELAAKDMRYLHAAAQAQGLQVPLLRQAGEVLAAAERQGLGGLHITGVLAHYEAQAAAATSKEAA